MYPCSICTVWLLKINQNQSKISHNNLSDYVFNPIGKHSQYISLNKEKVVVFFKLTPRSFLFMILMATFSPVRMCRPSFTLAKPPENTHRMCKIRWHQQRCFTHKHTLPTRANSLIQLIVSVELVGSAGLGPFHGHPPCFSRTMVTLPGTHKTV